MQKLTRDTIAAWAPPPPVSHAEWIPANVVIPAETETPGRFDLDTFPHVDGVMAAFDDPGVREIYLPWAARLGKTTIGLSFLISCAVNSPRPSMLGRENEEKIDDLIGSQFYPMLEACETTAGMLKPPRMRNKSRIDLKQNRIRRVFSGSPSTMAGFPACYGLASEVSKWSKRASTEADPVRLFSKRAMLFPFDSKLIYESTPGTKGQCNVTELAERPGVLRLQRLVPCPHCGVYQRLVLGGKEPEEPGIKWKKPRAGHSDPQVAEETAWYRCESGCRIEDSDRPEMMRAGVWLAENQTITKATTRNGQITKAGTIRGQRGESSKVAFGPLSSLYSLAISGWGQLAREFLDCAGDKEALRDFTNSVLGECWDPIPISVRPHELAERLCCDSPAGEVPEWAKILTAGIDVQDHGETFVWVVCGWGDRGRGQEVDHGISISFEDLEREVLHAKWRHADGGPQMMLTQSLIDSGSGPETEEIYGLCRGQRRLLPCKGMSRPFDLEYRIRELDPNQRRNKMARGRVTLVQINTDWTQQWLQRILEDRQKDGEAPFELAHDSGLDIDFLEELLNEQRIESIDDNGYPTAIWVRRDHHFPNDSRDALRYSRVAASIVTQQGRRWNKLPSRSSEKRKRTPRRQSSQRFSLLGRPDRPNLTPGS